MKKSTTTVTIVIVCLVLAMVAYYAHLSSQSRRRKEEANMTAVQEFLSRDLAKNYPSTPKEVMLYYNDFVKCLYNEECTNEEIESMGDKVRELYDAELLENNERDVYIVRLLADVQDFRDNKRRVINSSVAASDNVEYYTKDGYDCARILCDYTVLNDGTRKAVQTVYVLRRDENRRWKIMGWTDQANVED